MITTKQPIREYNIKLETIHKLNKNKKIKLNPGQCINFNHVVKIK